MGRGSEARIQHGQRGETGWHRRLSVRRRERTEESKLEITALCTASHNSDIVRSERKKLSEKLPRCEKNTGLVEHFPTTAILKREGAVG